MTTIRWRDGDGDWATPSDWNRGRAPQAGDDALIDTALFHTITHGSGDDTVRTLRVGNDDFVVSGGSLMITATSSFANLLSVGGTLALGGAATAARFDQRGTVSGAGDLTVSGAASVDGLQTGVGTTILEGASKISFLGLDGGRTLENRGTLTMIQYGEIDLGVNPFGETRGGATLLNAAGGVIDLQGVNHIGFVEQLPVGDVSFINAGTFKKTVQAGPAFVNIALTNTGAIRVETGTLEFDAGLTNSGAGTAHVASGATLRISGGGSSGASAFILAAGATLEFAQIFPGPNVFTLGAGTVGGSGTMVVSGGELALGAGAVTVTGFAQGNTTQSTCTVSGSGTLRVTGAATFGGGAMSQTGPGVTLLEGASILVGNVVGGLFLEGGRVLENQGTFTVQNGGFIELGSGAGDATLRNDAGGTIDLQGVATVARGAGASVLINAGLLEKTAGAGEAIVGVAVVNTGAIVARAATLEFLQSISGDGTLAVEIGATLEADAGAAASLSMAFKAGGGTLALHHAGAFAATIHGFSAGDAIDLLGKRADRAVLETGDRLAIFRGDRRLATLQLAGDYTGATFNLAADGAGGTDITVTTPAAIRLAAAPTRPFIDAMAGFAADSGGPAGAWTPSHAASHRPLLCKPRPTHFV
ncbi:MAG: hypothetical protein H0X27_07855 [Caulobacteraceae bacterium]|nr:hypothetical protein [Caulobacteraceae bacterium]